MNVLVANIGRRDLVVDVGGETPLRLDPPEGPDLLLEALVGVGYEPPAEKDGQRTRAKFILDRLKRRTWPKKLPLVAKIAAPTVAWILKAMEDAAHPQEAASQTEERSEALDVVLVSTDQRDLYHRTGDTVWSAQVVRLLLMARFGERIHCVCWPFTGRPVDTSAVYLWLAEVLPTTYPPSKIDAVYACVGPGTPQMNLASRQAALDVYGRSARLLQANETKAETEVKAEESWPLRREGIRRVAKPLLAHGDFHGVRRLFESEHCLGTTKELLRYAEARINLDRATCDELGAELGTSLNAEVRRGIEPYTPQQLWDLHSHAMMLWRRGDMASFVSRMTTLNEVMADHLLWRVSGLKMACGVSADDLDEHDHGTAITSRFKVQKDREQCAFRTSDRWWAHSWKYKQRIYDWAWEQHLCDNEELRCWCLLEPLKPIADLRNVVVHRGAGPSEADVLRALTALTGDGSPPGAAQVETVIGAFVTQVVEKLHEDGEPDGFYAWVADEVLDGMRG